MTRPQTKLFWLLLLLILFGVFARAWLSMELLFRTADAEHLQTLWRWSGIEGLAGWIGIIVLAIVDQSQGGRAKRILPWIVGAGALVACIATLTMDSRGTFEFAAAVILALAAAVLGLRQISQVTLRQDTTGAAGVTIEQLWRLLAVQWMLVWVSAEVFLRWRFRVFVFDDGARRLAVERLLFGLMAFGFLPNVLLATGLTWWPRLRDLKSATPAKPRAWIVSLIVINLGAIGLITACVGVQWAGAIGFAAASLGVLLYFAGFGRASWTGGRLIVLGWVAFLAGVLAFMLGLTGIPLNAAEMAAQLQHAAGWRSLVGGAFPLLWLMGFAGLAGRVFVAEKWRAREAAAVAKVLVALGVTLTAASLLAGKSGLGATSAGALMLMVGIIVAAAIMARGLRAARL